MYNLKPIQAIQFDGSQDSVNAISTLLGNTASVNEDGTLGFMGITRVIPVGFWFVKNPFGGFVEMSDVDFKAAFVAGT